MKQLIRAVIAASVLSLSSISTVMAETLTSELVSSWISSQSKVEVFSKKHESALDKYEANMNQQASPALAFQQGIIGLKATNLYSEFSDVVDDFGFSSPEQWAEVGGQVMNAFLALEVQAQGSEMQQMMQQMQSMMNSPEMKNMPPEQRDMMMQSMKQGMAMYQSAQNTPAADLDAVRPFLPKLRTLGEKQ